MKTPAPDFFRNFKFEYKITLTYLIFGFLWILFSDKLLDLLVVDNSLLTEFQTFKGTFFIIITSGLLFLPVKRHMQNLKNTESQLIESEFRFNRLWENGPFGLMTVDQQFQYKHVNPTFCKILGYSEDELLKLTFKDISHPEELVKDLPNVRKLINKEISVYKTEKRYIRKDGQVIWGALTVTANYDKEGRFLYNLAIVEDITRRKLAEEDLKKSKQLLSETESIGKVGGWEFNIDTKLQTWTDEVYRIHEVDFDYNQNVDKGIEFYTTESKPIIEKAVQRVIELGEPFDVELEIVTAKGNLRKVHSIGKADPEHRRVYGFFQDITERKLLEESLQKNEARLRNIFEQANDGIYIISADNQYLDANEKGLELLGYSKDELLKLNVSDVLYPDEVARLAIEPPQMMAGVPHLAEWIHVRKDGSTFPGEVSARRLNNQSYLAIIRNLTERKHSEDEIKRLNERIVTATRASQVGIWDWDVTNNRLTWDDQMYALYGLKRDEFSGAYEAWVSGLHPDDREFCRNETRLALVGEKEYDTEFRVVWPDGTVRYEKAKGEVFRNEMGDPIRMVGVNYDISERKLIEKELQESEEYLKLGYETANLGIWKNDLNSMTVEFDQRARIHYGFDEYTVTLSDVMARIHPDDIARLVFEIEKATAPSGNGKYATEYRVIHPDDTIHWLYIGVRVIFEGEGKNRRSVMGYGTSLDITQIKKAKEDLEESKSLLETALSSMTDAVFISDTEGRFIDFNDAFATFHKFKNKEECAKTLNEYPEFLEVYLSEGELATIEQWAVPRALNGEIVKNAEYRLRRKDTGETWIGSYSFSPIRDNNGVISGSVVTARDITEQKQAEEKVRKKDMEFRKLSANVPDLLFQFTRRPDGTYCVPIASEGIQNIFGCLPEDVLDDFTPIGRVIYPEDAERVIHDIEYSAGHLTYFTCEFRVQIPGREIQWIYSKSTPEQLPDGSITWYGFNTDITHQKQAEAALRESEEKFRMLIERIPLPVTYINKEGEIIFRNARFLQLFGYNQDEVPTLKEWWIKAYPDKFYRKWVIKKWDAAVMYATQNNTDIESEEYRVTCKDGTERMIIISGIIINGNLLNTLTDITDRKKAEDEVRKLNETLEQRVEERTTQLQVANRELEAFSYSVSHDLRAPLRHINGYINLLNDRFKDDLPEKAHHYLSTVTDAAKQMGMLIDDLLQFSRTGRQEMRMANLDMNILVHEALDKIKPDMENREIKWSVPVMPEIIGDYALLKQVWINLLDNAVKYTKLKEYAEIVIDFKEEKENFVFSVRDNGVGFDMKYAHKLFGVFQRLHSQSDFEGTGIGLANVQRIIHKHNGNVWAKAEPNNGATFFFTIPKNKEN